MKPAGSITSVADLLRVLADVKATFPPEGGWWRGHSDASWRLRPKLYRLSRPPDAEQHMALSFRARAQSRYARCPDAEALHTWLFLMQHYGLPTRLLDWTESPLVAAFFAAWEHPKRDGALWVLEAGRLNERTLGKTGLAVADDVGVLPLFKAAFHEAVPGLPKVAAVPTDEIDPRMMTQLSVFTIHDEPVPLEDAPYAAGLLRTYEIPSATKEAITSELADLGVNQSTLFPDLDHLAADIAAGRSGPEIP